MVNLMIRWSRCFRTLEMKDIGEGETWSNWKWRLGPDQSALTSWETYTCDAFANIVLARSDVNDVIMARSDVGATCTWPPSDPHSMTMRFGTWWHGLYYQSGIKGDMSLCPIILLHCHSIHLSVLSNPRTCNAQRLQVLQAFKINSIAGDVSQFIWWYTRYSCAFWFFVIWMRSLTISFPESSAG